jgi:hypothetical protein
MIKNPYENLVLASEEEALNCHAIAAEWYEKSEQNRTFSDCAWLTKRSVAEFVANQMGMTLYEHRANVH